MIRVEIVREGSGHSNTAILREDTPVVPFEVTSHHFHRIRAVLLDPSWYGGLHATMQTRYVVDFRTLLEMLREGCPID